MTQLPPSDRYVPGPDRGGPVPRAPQPLNHVRRLDWVGACEVALARGCSLHRAQGSPVHPRCMLRGLGGCNPVLTLWCRLDAEQISWRRSMLVTEVPGPPGSSRAVPCGHRTAPSRTSLLPIFCLLVSCLPAASGRVALEPSPSPLVCQPISLVLLLTFSSCHHPSQTRVSTAALPPSPCLRMTTTPSPHCSGCPSLQPS